MTYLNTQHTLQFIQRNDKNGNGLSKQELMQGAMNSYMQMMQSMATGNQQGMMEAFQDLSTASQLTQGFDVIAQASGQFMPDNSNTISGFDVLKTAMNDGNVGNISNYDLASQNNQNQTNNSWGVFNFGNTQSAQQSGGVMVGGQMFPDLSNWNSQQQQPLNYNNSYFSGGVSGYSQAQPSNGVSGQGALGGILAGGALALATGGAALPFMGIGALVGSGIAGNALEGLGGLTQSLGQGIQSFGDFAQKPFDKVGEFLGKIPVVGGALEGLTKLSGKLLVSLPTKLLGKGVELGGKLVSGIGKAVNKVGKFLKKL